MGFKKRLRTLLAAEGVTAYDEGRFEDVKEEYKLTSDRLTSFEAIILHWALETAEHRVSQSGIDRSDYKRVKTKLENLLDAMD